MGFSMKLHWYRWQAEQGVPWMIRQAESSLHPLGAPFSGQSGGTDSENEHYRTPQGLPTPAAQK